MRTAVLFCGMLVAGVLPAWNHTLQITGMTIHVQQSGTLVSVLAHSPLLGGDDATAALERRVKVRLDGVAFVPHSVSVTRDAQFDTVTWSAQSPVRPASIVVESPVFPDRPEDTTVVLVYRDGQLTDKTALNRSHPTALVGENLWAILRRFVRMGWGHIFAGPDHILFVLGLILAGGRWRNLLLVVSAFTVAHSITLSLTVLGVTTLPSRVVEMMIALSVVAVGLGNARRERTGAEICVWMAFGFGFFHGFGFAAALVESGLPARATGASLLAFNSGVEAGQLAVVSVVGPLMSMLRLREPVFAARASRFAGVGISTAGVIWLVQRWIQLA